MSKDEWRNLPEIPTSVTCGSCTDFHGKLFIAADEGQIVEYSIRNNTYHLQRLEIEGLADNKIIHGYATPLFIIQSVNEDLIEITNEGDVLSSEGEVT